MSTTLTTKCDGCGKSEPKDISWPHVSIFDEADRELGYQHWCSKQCKHKIFTRLTARALEQANKEDRERIAKAKKPKWNNE